MFRMTHRRIKAVLFDLGDTLVSFGKVRTIHVFLEGARTSHAFLKESDQPVGSFARYFLENLGYIRFRYLISNLTGKDFDALDLLKSIGRKKGTQLSQEQWEHLAWLWYEPLTRLGQIEDDLSETLTTLKQQGLKLGIVSNTFVNRCSLEKHLRALGILDFFPMRMFSYEFDCRKPDMEIFRIAAGKIGADLENILFVGDRIDKDVRPALKTGMEAALKDAYTNAGKATPSRAHRIRLLSELPALIESINAKAAQHCPTGSLGAAR
jgi:HAD superfamily hydrolase (TIGR01549 family)